MRTVDNKPGLTLIRGGKLSVSEFIVLPMEKQIDYLHQLKGEDRLDMIMETADPETLAQALPPQDIYQIYHEMGNESGGELVLLASPLQLQFIFDWELWNGWDLSLEKAMEWIEIILAADNDKRTGILASLDQELLLLILKKTVSVGGGLGEIINSEDYQEEWDHTFDECYYLKFRKPECADTMLRLIEMIYRTDPLLYRSLMIGVECELESELEELTGQFRRNRLADEGFPSPEEAGSIYSRISPEHFTVGHDKIISVSNEEILPLPVIPAAESSLLHKAYTLADSAALRREFHYLVNSALVAEGISPSNHEKMHPVLERVGNYLNLALEYLCEDNEHGAVTILTGEHLKTLFSLGHSLLMNLQDRAKKVESDNYASDKLLLGLKMRRPRFYRGLDPDMVDNYREFSGIEDIRKADQFLRTLEQG